MAVALAAPADDFPRRMDIEVKEVHQGERSSLVVRVGAGARPWCKWGPMRAELGARGFCPSCAGPILAMLQSGARP